MATQWIPLTRFEPRSWLLGNGEIIKEPSLERTASNRKVRVVGTTESVYNGDLESLLGRAARSLATQKGTNVLLDLTQAQEHERAELRYDPTQTKAELHLVHSPTDKAAKTICWWRYKHPTMPFEVVLSATLSNHAIHSTPTQQAMSVSAVIPARTYYESMDPSWQTVTDENFSAMTNLLTPLDSQLRYKWIEFIRDNPPNWPAGLLGSRNHPQQRGAVAAFLAAVRELEDIDTIQVPDFSDPYKPAWMNLELYQTNVNNTFIDDMKEYLDGAPTIEQVAGMYDEILKTLRSIGIAVSGKSANDFMAALLAGEKSTLNMDVLALAEEGYQVDQDHKLSVHLPSGSFIVSCTHKGVDKGAVHQEWEEARTVAALTGNESELLAYARAYAQKHSEGRTQRILSERVATPQ